MPLERVSTDTGRVEGKMEQGFQLYSVLAILFWTLRVGR